MITTVLDRSVKISEKKVEQYQNFSDRVEKRYKPTSRILDVLGALLLLTVFAVPMLLIALVIRLETKDGIIYKQTRLGLNQKPFVIFKFRSMSTSSVAKLGFWSIEDQNRITRTGKVLRKFRLDELPQLFNIIRGDMSLIGPRPEQPQLAQAITREIPDFMLRTKVKPGLTGLAQVSFGYGENISDAAVKLQYDLEWMEKHNWLVNLKILFLTIVVMLARKGSL